MLALPPHSVVLLTPSILSLSLSSLFLQAIVNICAVAQGTDIAGEKKKERKKIAFNRISLLVVFCHVDIEPILPAEGRR